MADIVVKDLAKSAAKYAQRAQGAAQAYADGVASTPKDQSALAIAAAPRWQAGVELAAQNGLYAKGLQKTGTAGWKAGVAAKGASRFGPGAAAAQGKWQNGFAKSAAALSSLSLPPRAPRGDPSNQARSTAVQQALHAARLQP